MQKFIDHLWGVLGFSGGATGSLIGWISLDRAIDTALIAVIGGVIGTVVGLIIKELWYWTKKKMR